MKRALTMDNEVKQRNRRRKRAQRMQAQRESKVKDGDSGEDDSPVRDKPQRPPIRRRKSKEPLVEEDIVDGFAILGFRSYDDLEAVIKLASKAGIRRLTSTVVEEKLKTEKESQRNISITSHHITAHTPAQHGLTLSHDPGTSDDSGRASERLTGSSVAPRDPDSSRDRLSDASSRCSSGKGYICDSEGEDDKGSDAGSVLFASTPSARKLEFPSALSIGNGDSASPVPAPTPPAASPAAAALPPPQAQYQPAATVSAPPPPRLPSPPGPAPAAVSTPPSSVPVTMPQPAPAAAPAPAPHLPPALDSSADVNHSRTDSPAVATSANVAVAPASTATGQYTGFPLYAPYAVHSPAPASAATTSTAAATVTTTSSAPRTHSPRGHSPTRERDSYSSNVSSLSRGSVTPFSTAPPPTATVSSSLAFSKPAAAAAAAVVASAPVPQAWGTSAPPPPVSSASAQLSPATSVPRPTPPLPSIHSYPAPMFAPPPLPPVSTASSLVPAPNPNPFSAESLFQSNQTDMLRRELDNRFLASQDRTLNVGPPPYLRTEMHQHQHHHTHVHQHTTPLLPPPPSSTLFPTPLFKELPKMGSVDSPFYRQNLGISSYPGYSPGLLHPGIGGPTPFVPPNHLPTFQPKQPIGDAPPKPKPPVKSGKWNAMHVRVAWEIYHHQQKQQSEVKSGVTKTDLLRPPSHIFPGSLIHSARPHELSFPSSLAGAHRPPQFDHQPHPGSLFSNPAHLVNGSASSGMSPFSRYGTAFNAPGSPFGMSPFPGRELPPLGPMHDPWSRLQRFPPAPVPQSPWGLKPDPAVLERREQEERERERERERLRREREERERREREEKQRKLEQQQQQERERERREKERREMERREMEREREREQRERERERMLHQQRMAESSKQAAAAAAMAARDRSPLRNGTSDMNEVRVKEEPRTKEEDVVMLGRTDPRYHPYLNRHPSLPPHSMLDRSRSMLPPSLGGPLPSHFPPPPPASHWPGPDPFRDPYRFDPLRYNPLVEAAMRAEEERAKLFSAYASHPAHLRGKDAGPPPAGLLHMRPGPGPGPPPHKLCATPPTTDLHKKDDSSQSR